jgi:tetratricopeptide (TPR) repeat protein
LGRWLHASFVLRTFTVEGVQQPVLTFVDRSEFLVDEAPMSRVTSAQLATLDQTQLPSDVILAARCVVALSYYRQLFFEQSVTEFNQILAVRKLPALSPPRANLEFYLGTALLKLQRPDETISNLQQSVKLENNTPEVHNNLAESFYAKSEVQLATLSTRKRFR